MEASPKPTEAKLVRLLEREAYPEVNHRLFYVPGITPPPVSEAPELGVSIDLVIQNRKKGVMFSFEAEEVLMWTDCLREDARVVIYNGDLDMPGAILSKRNFERAMVDPRTEEVLTAREHAENAEGRFASFLKYLAKEYEGKVSPHILAGVQDG